MDKETNPPLVYTKELHSSGLSVYRRQGTKPSRGEKGLTGQYYVRDGEVTYLCGPPYSDEYGSFDGEPEFPIGEDVMNLIKVPFNSGVREYLVGLNSIRTKMVLNPDSLLCRLGGEQEVTWEVKLEELGVSRETALKGIERMAAGQFIQDVFPQMPPQGRASLLDPPNIRLIY